MLGVKFTENFMFCPGDSVIGALNPLKLKPEPGPISCVISSVVFPGLLNVIVWLLVTPTGTLPKLTLLGVSKIEGCTPVPASATATDPCLLESVRSPCTEPDADGRNDTLKFVDCPGSNARGRTGPLKLKPLPLTFTAVIVTFETPLFVTIKDWLLVAPTATLPKLKLLGAESDRCFLAANDEAQDETKKNKTTTTAAAIPLEVGSAKSDRSLKNLPNLPSCRSRFSR